MLSTDLNIFSFGKKKSCISRLSKRFKCLFEIVEKKIYFGWGLIKVDERQSSYFRKLAIKMDNAFIGFSKVCPHCILNGNYNRIKNPCITETRS